MAHNYKFFFFVLKLGNFFRLCLTRIDNPWSICSSSLWKCYHHVQVYCESYIDLDSILYNVTIWEKTSFNIWFTTNTKCLCFSLYIVHKLTSIEVQNNTHHKMYCTIWLCFLVSRYLIQPSNEELNHRTIQTNVIMIPFLQPVDLYL